MRIAAALLLLSLTGCYSYTHVEKQSVNLHTEAEGSQIVYDAATLYISLYSSKKDLVDLRALPTTAFLWTNFESYPLTLSNTSFDGHSPYDPKDGKVDWVGFKFNTPKDTQGNSVQLKPGFYNVSVQLNGSSGIYTVCGPFRIVKETKMVNSNDLHYN